MNVELEYRVKPVTRFVVTRFSDPEANSHNPTSVGKSELRGEFDSKYIAEAVAYALCKSEHEVLGWPVGDERVRYPSTSSESVIASE